MTQLCVSVPSQSPLHAVALSGNSPKNVTSQGGKSKNWSGKEERIVQGQPATNLEADMIDSGEKCDIGTKRKWIIQVNEQPELQ